MKIFSTSISVSFFTLVDICIAYLNRLPHTHFAVTACEESKKAVVMNASLIAAILWYLVQAIETEKAVKSHDFGLSLRAQAINCGTNGNQTACRRR